MEKTSARLLSLVVLALVVTAGLVQAIPAQQAPRISRSFVIILPHPVEGRAEFYLSTDAVSIHVLVEDRKAYVEAAVELAGNASLTMVVLSKEMDRVESVPSLIVDMPPLKLDEILARVVSHLVTEGYLREVDLATGIKVYNDTVTISYDDSALTFLINPELEWAPQRPLSIQATAEDTAVATATITQTTVTYTWEAATTTSTITQQATEQPSRVETAEILGNTSTQATHLIKISFATTTPGRAEEAGAGAVVAALIVGLLVALLSYIIVRMRL